MKSKGYAKFGGQIRCIMGDVQVADAQHRSYLIHAQSSGGDVE